MKLLVAFKQVPDPEAGNPDGPSPGGRWIVNPFDAIAIEEAVRLRERGAAAEAVGVTIASAAAEPQIRSALAMGLDRALRIDDDRALDPYAVARILVAVVRRENPDLVIMGKQAVDDDASQVGPMLAGLLGWPQATFISKLELLPDNRRIECARETDQGSERIAAGLPAVVTVDLRLNEPRYVSLPGLIRARSRPIDVLASAAIAPSVHPRTRVITTGRVASRRAGERVASVEDLLARLRGREKVL